MQKFESFYSSLAFPQYPSLNCSKSKTFCWYFYSLQSVPFINMCCTNSKTSSTYFYHECCQVHRWIYFVRNTGIKIFQFIWISYCKCVRSFERRQNIKYWISISWIRKRRSICRKSTSTIKDEDWKRYFECSLKLSSHANVIRNCYQINPLRSHFLYKALQLIDLIADKFKKFIKLT